MLPIVSANNNVLLQVQGQVLQHNNPASNKDVEIRQDGILLDTATTTAQGMFSRLVTLESDTECGDTVYLEFRVEGTKVGEYPVIACETATQTLRSLTITEKLIAPVEMGYFMLSYGGGSQASKNIPGSWDMCFLSAFGGRGLGGSSRIGCGVAPISAFNIKVCNHIFPTDCGGSDSERFAQQIIKGENWQNQDNQWKIVSNNDGGSRTECSAACVRFNN